MQSSETSTKQLHLNWYDTQIYSVRMGNRIPYS